MKTKNPKASKSAPPPVQELVPAEPPAARLCLLIRVVRDKRSRCAKLDGGGIVPASKGGVFSAKIVHVGMVAVRNVPTKEGGFVTRWHEEENLAEFDGPTSEDAAMQFVKLMPTRTPASAAHCIADGAVTKPVKWKQRSKHDETTVRYI